MTTLLAALHTALPCYSELSSNMCSRSNEESISNRGANGKISKIAIVAGLLCSQARDDVPMIGKFTVAHYGDRRSRTSSPLFDNALPSLLLQLAWHA
jgi:hypothetical protein